MNDLHVNRPGNKTQNVPTSILPPSAAVIIEERLQTLLENIILVERMSYEKLTPICTRDSGLPEVDKLEDKDLPPLFGRYQELIEAIDSNLTKIRYNLERVDL